MGLYLLRSNRTEALVERLAERFAAQPLPPLAQETIVVDGAGMERWLAQTLARRLGIWANPGFMYPRRMVLDAMEAVLGPAPGASPQVRTAYEPEVMTWAVAALLPGLLHQDDRFAAVQRYLGEAQPGSRRFMALCDHIARTLDDYVVFRQPMVLDWQAGGALGADAEQQWQPVLWRALVALLSDQHMAGRAQRFLAALQAGAPLAEGFPRRLTLFGLSTIAPLYLRMLLALHRQVEVHLCLLEPTAAYWSDLRSAREQSRASRRAGLSAEELHLDEGHPLLASLGKQGRDFRAVLDAAAERIDGDDDSGFAPPAATSLLTQLQADIFGLVHRHAASADAATGPVALRPDDASLRVHACHGPLRQVEVLHDQLLDLFAQDSTLQPADIVVMAPDIDAFVPAIDAVFGAAPEGQQLRYSIADRGVRATLRQVDAFFKLQATLVGRLGAPEVLDLLACEPVRERFGLTASDLTLVERWLAAVGIRWAEDERHREAVGHPALVHNSWRFGLERLLLGAAMPTDERELFAGVLPYDDVEGSDAEVLGKLARFCRTLFDYRQRLARPLPALEWQRLLGDLLAAFLRADRTEQFQHQLILDALQILTARAAVAGFAAPVELAPLQLQLQSVLESRRASLGFLTGAITFCSTVPMRAIPFRVVCLLGLDDDAFPRRVPGAGFDLLGKRLQPGDRNLRDDDRYLFLEALLSARERFIVCYTGQSPRDNATLPPSVVVSELLDVLAEGCFLPELVAQKPLGSPAMADAVRERLVVRHPLQPFSPRYFGGDVDARLFSYSAHGQAVAQALGAPHRPRPLFVDAPLPHAPERSAQVTLDELAAFFKNPARAYLQRGLGLFLDAEEGELDDVEPMELSELERWQLFEPVLAQLRAGRGRDEVVRAARATGRLPLGVQADVALKADLPTAEALVALADAQTTGIRRDDLGVALRCGATLLVGTVRELWPTGQVRVQWSKGKDHHLLRSWIYHLALCASARSGDPTTTWLIARDGKGNPMALCLAHDAEAHARLTRLVELYLLGLQVPLPFFPRSSWAYANALGGKPGARRGAKQGVAQPAAANAMERERKARKAAADVYFDKGSERGFPEETDRHVGALFAGLDPLQPGFRCVAVPGQAIPDFAQLAVEVYGPLLAKLAEEP